MIIKMSPKGKKIKNMVFHIDCCIEHDVNILTVFKINPQTLEPLTKEFYT